MKIYGYIRVSAGNQNEDRQLIAMKNAQVPRNNIFLDKQSGCNFDRPMYRKMSNPFCHTLKYRNKKESNENCGTTIITFFSLLFLSLNLMTLPFGCAFLFC